MRGSKRSFEKTVVIALKRLEIIPPVVHLVRTGDSLWNVPTIGKQDSPSDSVAGILFTIQNAVLRDGSLTIKDRSVSPARTEQVNVAARLAGLGKVHSARLPVASPQPDTSEGSQPRVELQLEAVDAASVLGRASSVSKEKS